MKLEMGERGGVTEGAKAGEDGRRRGRGDCTIGGLRLEDCVLNITTRRGEDEAK